MARDFALAFYKSAAWERARKLALVRSKGLCEECIKRGIIKPARLVHHKVPITPENVGDPTVTLSLDNLECLCLDCHADVHARMGTYGRLREPERARVAFDEGGNVVRLDSIGGLSNGGDEV